MEALGEHRHECRRGTHECVRHMLALTIALSLLAGCGKKVVPDPESQFEQMVMNGAVLGGAFYARREGRAFRRKSGIPLIT